MCDEYKEVYTGYFDKKFKKACKKHKRCFENDFNVLVKTLKANKKETPKTEQIAGLGQKYSAHRVYKTRMHITELKQFAARVVWHLNETRKNFLFIDVYLKSEQTNHETKVIQESLEWYYSCDKK